jgi:hypothetical protein
MNEERLEDATLALENQGSNHIKGKTFRSPAKF